MKRRNALPLAILAGGIAVAPLPAALIAHYDFSDGDLYDNEVGSSYKLVQKTAGKGVAKVTLNSANGSAVIPGGRTTLGAIAWLETKGPGKMNRFTVSFWFRTAKVDQDQPFMGLFSSDTETKDGDWELYSDGSSGGDKGDNGQLGWRCGRGKNKMDVPPHKPNVWYHVVIRKNASDAFKPTQIYLTEQGQQSVRQIYVCMDRSSCLDKFIIGANRTKNQSYAMEVANIKIYDDVKVSLDDLLKEGPGGGKP